MREHEAGRRRTPGRWHPWVKRISSVAAHVSAASLLASGLASSLAARKHKSRSDDRGARDQTDRDRGGNDRNREDKHANDPREDRRLQQENRDSSHGGGNGRHDPHSGKQELQVDESSDVHSAASQKTPTATPTPTPSPSDGGGGGGGGGKGDGGGLHAGNAGSGLFDNPLATKARRRANDFDNANQEDEDDGIFVDVHPDGESVYETDSVHPPAVSPSALRAR